MLLLNSEIKPCVFSWPSFVFVDSLKPQIQQHVSDQFIGFSFMNNYYWISLNSRNFDLKTSLNRLTKVSIVSFNSTENSSDKDVDFWRTKTFVAASFSWLNILMKNDWGCGLHQHFVENFWKSLFYQVLSQGEMRIFDNNS